MLHRVQCKVPRHNSIVYKVLGPLDFIAVPPAGPINFGALVEEAQDTHVLAHIKSIADFHVYLNPHGYILTLLCSARHSPASQMELPKLFVQQIDGVEVPHTSRLALVLHD